MVKHTPEEKRYDDPVLCYVDGDDAWFTERGLFCQWGDDWNDAPYQHNAGRPYEFLDSDDCEPYNVIRVKWWSPLDCLEPWQFDVSVSVEEINREKLHPWIKVPADDLANNLLEVYAGTPLSKFKGIIERSGGVVIHDVYPYAFLPWHNIANRIDGEKRYEDPVLCFANDSWAWFTTRDLNYQDGKGWGDGEPIVEEVGPPYRSSDIPDLSSGDYKLIRIAWSCPVALLGPWDYGWDGTVYDVNRKKERPWLRTTGQEDKRPMVEVSIYAGMAISQFKRAIELMRGKIYTEHTADHICPFGPQDCL